VQQLSVPLPPGPQFVIPGPPVAQLGGCPHEPLRQTAQSPLLQYAGGGAAQGQSPEFGKALTKALLYSDSDVVPIAALIQLVQAHEVPSCTPTQSESDVQDWS
jgi:hypothetical protein